MSQRGRKKSGSPPSWWSLDLYDFVSSMDLHGWAWEFERRASLKSKLGSRPVDALNPEPEPPERLELSVRPYYKSWADETCLGRRHSRGISSVLTKDRASTIEYSKANYEWLRIDLNHSNRILKNDFNRELKKLRRNFPKPPKLVPKPESWVEKHALEIWDLRQFKVSWYDIGDLVGLNDPDIDRPTNINIVKKANRPGERYIDSGYWYLLLINIH